MHCLVFMVTLAYSYPCWNGNEVEGLSGFGLQVIPTSDWYSLCQAICIENTRSQTENRIK